MMGLTDGLKQLARRLPSLPCEILINLTVCLNTGINALFLTLKFCTIFMSVLCIIKGEGYVERI
jgi:hypothetical protein